jgi:pimeloyl-ACP methyl ester carboxylesterase
MQTHHVPVEIAHGYGSKALWALQPKGVAILFVHGFGGSATNTWIQFPSILQSEVACQGCDFIFYGYDGLRIRARPNADLLIDLLDELFGKPATFIERSLPTAARPKKFKYRKIVIVAHSLGAVVSRLALIDALRRQRGWTPKTELVLFAPAHGGASILPLATLAMGALKLAPVEAFARYKFQVLHDLERSSKTLRDLESHTRSAILQGAKNLIARRVIYAGNDKIVDPIDFCDDPPPEFIHKVSHTGVCKPRSDFKRMAMTVRRLTGHKYGKELGANRQIKDDADRVAQKFRPR